jgi:hypothetical protein
VDAVRALIRRGKLATVRGNDGRLLVSVPPGLAQVADQPRPGEDEASDQSSPGVRLGQDEEVARLLVERDEALAEADHWRDAAHKAELAAATRKAEVAAKDEVIADLREQLAWHRLPWWRRLIR